MSTQIPSTQQFIPIADIRQGIVILKNGGLRAICQVYPVNFALKSQQDQAVLFGQFQNFLNSLTFPIQLIVQSRRLDVFPYLKSLSDHAANISEELLRIHAFDYINFVAKLTELTNVMEKKFFCVVPYEASPTDNPTFVKKLFSSRAKVSISKEQFTKYSQELEQRVQVIIGGLSGMSLVVKRLETQAMIEEFYYVYNPEEAQEERLGELEKISAPVISSKMPKIAVSSPANKTLEKPVDNTAYKLNPDVSQEKPLVDAGPTFAPVAGSQTPRAPVGTAGQEASVNTPKTQDQTSPQQPSVTAGTRETKPTPQDVSPPPPSAPPAKADQESIDPSLQKDLDAILNQLNQ